MNADGPNTRILLSTQTSVVTTMDQRWSLKCATGLRLMHSDWDCTLRHVFSQPSQTQVKCGTHGLHLTCQHVHSVRSRARVQLAHEKAATRSAGANVPGLQRAGSASRHARGDPGHRGGVADAARHRQGLALLGARLQPRRHRLLAAVGRVHSVHRAARGGAHHQGDAAGGMGRHRD